MFKWLMKGIVFPRLFQTSGERLQARCGKPCNTRSMLREKSRARWIREGDSNSEYFHSVMKRNFHRNDIVVLNSDRDLLSQVDDIKLEVFSHFHQRFLDPEVHMPMLLGVNFNRLSESYISMLEEPFSMEEVKDAI